MLTVIFQEDRNIGRSNHGTELIIQKIDVRISRIFGQFFKVSITCEGDSIKYSFAVYIESGIKKMVNNLTKIRQNSAQELTSQKR